MDRTETLAMVGCYWLIAMFAVGVATDHFAPLFVSIAIALWLTRSPKPAPAPIAPRRRRRRMTRAGITAAALIGWAATYFTARSL